MSQNDSTDEELMIQYQKGSESAFQLLYQRHSGKIYGYLKKRMGTEEKVSDLFQEVFVKIHKSKTLYNSALPVLPWFFSITRSVTIDSFRVDKRKNEIFGYDFDQISAPSTENQAGDVSNMLKGIPENQRAAISMRYLNENTFEEIADRLKTSPINARQLISRGIKSLKSFTKKGDAQ